MNLLSPSAQGRVRPLSAAYFGDPDGSTGAAAIAAQDFRPGPCDGIFPAPPPGEALWLRFTVARPGDGAPIPGNWAVAFAETIFDEVTFFERRGAALVPLLRKGRTVPPEERLGVPVKTVLALDIAAGQEKTYYLRLAGTFNPSVTPLVGPAELFRSWSALSMAMSAVFLGFVTAIALVAVILFRHIEARFFKYYLLYMLCQFGYPFFFDGWFTQIFGATLPVTVLMRAADFSAALAVFANIQYCRILLEIDADPRWRRGLLSALTAATLAAGALAVADPWNWAEPLHLAYFGCPIVLLGLCLLKLREGLPQAWPILGSLLSLILGLFTAYYFFNNPIPIAAAESAFDLVLAQPTDWAFYFAILGEVAFMALAISIMMKSIRVQRQAALRDAAAARRTAAAQAKALQASGERIEALEASLHKQAESERSARQRPSFTQAAAEQVLEHLGEEGFGSRQLAAVLGMSEKTLGRRLKDDCGLSPAALIRSVRLDHARVLIRLGRPASVAQVAYASGFASVGHFAKLYRLHFGEAPSDSLKAAKVGPQPLAETAE
ncbi:MAG: helix-turn-helix domain-containing protein [Kiloniellaceae bacterium]